MKKVLVLLALLIVAGAGAFLAISGDDEKATTETSKPAGPVSTARETAKEVQTVTITYTDSGFSPSTLFVNAGDSVLIKNDSSNDLDFESNPHPVHTDNTELNAGTIENGGSKTITLTEPGTWGFHNHDNSAHSATVEVK
ncbi:MAG TPA: cupredoxin domain-containing protein [Candidatus Saccharimonadales bacterium]|nr:cupredoxin domain-containing protein [Candidatus Saccharimonadales bacterium]